MISNGKIWNGKYHVEHFPTFLFFLLLFSFKQFAAQWLPPHLFYISLFQNIVLKPVIRTTLMQHTLPYQIQIYKPCLQMTCRCRGWALKAVLDKTMHQNGTLVLSQRFTVAQLGFSAHCALLLHPHLQISGKTLTALYFQPPILLNPNSVISLLGRTEPSSGNSPSPWKLREAKTASSFDLPKGSG